jgi:hypothetical protein
MALSRCVPAIEHLPHAWAKLRPGRCGWAGEPEILAPSLRFGGEQVVASFADLGKLAAYPTWSTACPTSRLILLVRLAEDG